MRKKLALFICLFPGLLMAASASGDCPAASGEETGCDSIQAETTLSESQNPPLPSSPAVPKTPDDKSIPYDWKQNGLFHAIFHVGVNFAQIDGDAYAGYNKPGFDGGAGVLVRFHKYFSASAELNYTQWGAKYTLVTHPKDSAALYRVKLDYIQIPLSINVQDKEIVMFSLGMNIGFPVRYDERNEWGVDITDTVQPRIKNIDLDAFAALHFIIKKQFGIGLKFSYSMLPFRGVEAEYKPYTRVNGEYNNVITIRFMYILSAWKKKQK